MGMPADVAQPPEGQDDLSKVCRRHYYVGPLACFVCLSGLALCPQLLLHAIWAVLCLLLQLLLCQGCACCTARHASWCRLVPAAPATAAD